MRQPTSYLLLEKAIGEPLHEYLRKLREDERTWTYIARAIKRRTGIEVSDETLRRWHRDVTERADATGNAA